MKKLSFLIIAIFLSLPASAADTVSLANDAWPPFILEGDEPGTAEQLVCQALERAGWQCSLKVIDWDVVLADAQSGAIDGIAAAWHQPEREVWLLYSEPYLTNRIVPVVDANKAVSVKSVSDLVGLKVAMVTDYAYGDEIDTLAARLDVVKSRNSAEAIQALREGRADVALVDELVARDQLGDNAGAIVTINSVLAFRSLHFAVSRMNPRAEEIIADFHRAYEAMLSDGTVNEILNIDWLATDFGHKGQIDVVMRSGASLDTLAHPSKEGSIYALEKSEYQLMANEDLEPDRVKYQVEGKSYSSLQSALNNVFGTEIGCEHQEFKSEFDCTNLFKKR